MNISWIWDNLEQIVIIATAIFAGVSRIINNDRLQYISLAAITLIVPFWAIVELSIFLTLSLGVSGTAVVSSAVWLATIIATLYGIVWHRWISPRIQRHAEKE